MSDESTATVIPKARISSIDQFRGYAILGMLLVDYFGIFRNSWSQLQHAPTGTGMTFADLVAPIFMFVVGMGMRLSFKKRAEHEAVWETRKSLIKRYVLLVLIAFFFYTGYLWDALTNIGLAGLLAVWVVDRKPSVRVVYALIFLGLYQFVFTYTSYGDLIHRIKYTDETMPLIWKIIPFGPELLNVPINGGPLGHWSWLTMLLGGTIAFDVMMTKDTKKIIIGCLGWAAAFGIAGWVMRAEWPGVKEFWPFVKTWTTTPYSLWSTSLCFLHLLGFYLVCDIMKIKIPHLTTLGINPLFIYLLQWCIMETAHRFLPKEFPMVPLWIGWFLFYGVCYGTALYLRKKNILIKL
jgi:predicted acyltransferase